LERPFQPVMISKPGPLDILGILKGLKGWYELHHGVKICNDVLVAAVDFSRIFISKNFLQDIAIGFINDEPRGLKPFCFM